MIIPVGMASDYTLDQFCQDMNVVFTKINIHSINIANSNTTRTANGGYFKRQLIKNCSKGHCELIEDESEPEWHYEPTHPDADSNGYVAYPSFAVQEELSGLIKAQRAYDLLAKVAPFKAIDLVVGNKLDECFKHYPFFKDGFDFKTTLGR